jgi:hypothetical protein
MEHVNVVEYGWRRNLIVIAVMLASLLETLRQFLPSRAVGMG